MEKITYNNVRSTKAVKPGGNKTQKSVADELIFALSKPKIKKEIKEEVIEDILKTQQASPIKKIVLKDFQVTIAKNLNPDIKNIDTGKDKVPDIKNINTVKEKVVKLSNKTYFPPKQVFTNTVQSKQPPTADEKVAIKNKVNSNWINFLKNKQDAEPTIVDDDIVEIEEVSTFKAQKQPKRKINNKKEAVRTTVASPITKSTPAVPTPVFDINKDKVVKKQETEKDKDLILKNLMTQVAQLEVSMGANISKLESQLQEEKDKCKKLEDDLEVVNENYSDVAAKLVGLQQNKTILVEEHRKKIIENEEKLKVMKNKNSELSKELSKADKTVNAEKKLKDRIAKDLIALTKKTGGQKEELDNLITWKEEAITKIKTSIMYCQEEHVQKILNLENCNEQKNGMIVEVSARISLMMQEYSSSFNLKDKEIDSLKVGLIVKEEVIKDNDKKLTELEMKIKEKEDNEEKYKEKVDRYREKDDRYKEKEDKFREKEKKFKEKEEKFTELDRRLKEKERKFKENEEKLRLKEDEMFRVYELVNQLQMRMKNEKINPIVNGQDILAIGKSKCKSVEAKPEVDEEICILPTPVKTLETSSKTNGISIGKDKNQERVNSKNILNNGPRSDRKVSSSSNVSRYRKENSSTSREMSKSRIYFETNRSPTKQVAIDVSSINSSSRPELVKLGDTSPRSSEERKSSTSSSQSKAKDPRFSNVEKRKSETSSKGSKKTSDNIEQRMNFANSKKSPLSSVYAIGLNKSKSPCTVIKNSPPRTSTVSPGNTEENILTKPISPGLKSCDMPVDETFETKANTIIEPSTGNFSSSTKLAQTLKRKREPESEIIRSKNKVAIEEDEILLLDDDDDDIQCVMEVKAVSEENTSHLIEQSEKNKNHLKEAVKNLLMEENEKTDTCVKNPESLDTSIELLEMEHLEVNSTNVNNNSGNVSKSKSSEVNLTNSRMKAADFFQDVDVNVVQHLSVSDVSNETTYDENLELEKWISTELRKERKKMDEDQSEGILNRSIDSESDSSQETLKQLFLQDLELDLVGQSEADASKPVYVNPDISWTLKKWPNLPERLATQNESPNVKNMEGETIFETEVQDPRLRRKKNINISVVKASNEQCVAMKKVNKELGQFHIPRSAKVLMLPYLWPLVKYVKRDLMNFYDEASVTNTVSEGEKEDVTTSSIPVVELDNEHDEESTLSLLYDDLEVSDPVDSEKSDKFSTKRTWDEMRKWDLSQERIKIIGELQLVLNSSGSSNISSLDETDLKLEISFDEQKEIPSKKLKTSLAEDASLLVQCLIEECIQKVGLEDEITLSDTGDNEFDIDVEHESPIVSANFVRISDIHEESKIFKCTGSDDDLMHNLRKHKSTEALLLTTSVKRKPLTCRPLRKYFGR